MEGCFAMLMVRPIVLAIFPAWIGSAVWAYCDNKGRDVPRAAGPLVVLLFSPVSLFGRIWLRDRLAMRPDA